MVRKVNPWAVCSASVGRKNKSKYERCVMDVKEKNKLDDYWSELSPRERKLSGLKRTQIRGWHGERRRHALAARKRSLY